MFYQQNPEEKHLQVVTVLAVY